MLTMMLSGMHILVIVGLEDKGLTRMPKYKYLSDDTEFQVYISKNTTKRQRTGKIYFYNRDTKKKLYIAVKQSGK